MEGNKTLGEIQLTEWWAVGRQVAVKEGWEGDAACKSNMAVFLLC